MPTQLEDTLGLVLLGVFISLALYGVTLAQTASYFSQTCSDKIGNRVVVIILLLCSTIQSAFLCSAQYHSLIYSYGNILGLIDITWQLSTHPPLVGLMILSTHCFYIHKVWVFSGENLVLPSLLFMLSLAQLGTNFAFMIKMQYISPQAIFDLGADRTFLQLSFASLYMPVLADVGVVAALCYYIVKRRMLSTIFVKSYIRRILILTIETNIMTCAISLAALFALWIDRHKQYYTMFLFTSPKVYHFTVLYTLNSRNSARQGDSPAASVPIDLPNTSYALNSVERNETLSKAEIRFELPHRIQHYESKEDWV